MSITFAAQLNRMITAGLGGAMDAPETNVAIGYRYTEKTASGNPISFSDGAGGKPIKSLEIGFNPVQGGSGTPAPDNVRPITGWTQLDLHHADATEVIQLGDTYYAGTVDAVNGTLTLTRQMVTLDGTNQGITSIALSGATGNYYCTYSIDNSDTTASAELLSNMLANDGTAIANKGNMYITSGGTFVFVLPDQSLTTKALVNAWLAQNNLQICYTLATATTVTITPLDIVTQEGGNIFITDANGGMSITYTAVGYTEGY